MAQDHSGDGVLADAAAQARDLAGLQQYAPLLEELARRDDHQPYLAVAGRAWGVAHTLAGRYDEAQSRLQEALEIFEGLNARWQIGRTRAELAQLARARGDEDAAEAHFAAALAEFEALGAVPDFERTRRSSQQKTEN